MLASLRHKEMHAADDELGLVELVDVKKYYMLGETRVDALRGVSVTIEKGVFPAIAGPSGSGKSTIRNMIGCIDTPSDGRVLIDGTEGGASNPRGLMKRFPMVNGSDLNGRTVNLPADLPGPASLVFVPFEMHQQEDVDSWQPFVQKMNESLPTLKVLELPTISRGYLLMRFIIDNGMRSGIRDLAARASTITLYIDVKAFIRDLGLKTTKEIAVFVVKPSGEIMARLIGRYSEAGAATIATALEALR